MIIARLSERELLLKHMLKEEGKMLRVDVELYGSANFSRYSFCKDCKRQIQDRSRSRKRARCEPCSTQHMIVIKRISATRIAREKKEERLAEKEKKLCKSM